MTIIHCQILHIINKCFGIIYFKTYDNIIIIEKDLCSMLIFYG